MKDHSAQMPDKAILRIIHHIESVLLVKCINTKATKKALCFFDFL